MNDAAGGYRRARICLVHIVWSGSGGARGLEPLRRFVSSYRSFDPGVGHDLVVVFKGFADPTDAHPHLKELSGVGHETIDLSDDELDVATYREVAERVDHDHVCFLNSGSVILADRWLARLHDQSRLPEVGLVGATGSWESHYTWLLDFIAAGGGPRWKRRQLRRSRKAYPPFPNPHLRVNAFMLPRTLFLELRVGRPRKKWDAYIVESGRDSSLTRQVAERGLAVRVVGRDGTGYDSDAWPESRTFRFDDQQNLLVADNRTIEYEMATPAERDALSRRAWGRIASGAAA